MGWELLVQCSKHLSTNCIWCRCGRGRRLHHRQLVHHCRHPAVGDGDLRRPGRAVVRSLPDRQRREWSLHAGTGDLLLWQGHRGLCFCCGLLWYRCHHPRVEFQRHMGRDSDHRLRSVGFTGPSERCHISDLTCRGRVGYTRRRAP